MTVDCWIKAPDFLELVEDQKINKYTMSACDICYEKRKKVGDGLREWRDQQGPNMAMMFMEGLSEQMTMDDFLIC